MSAWKHIQYILGLGPAEEYLDEESSSVRSAAGCVGAERTVMPELSCLLDSFPMFGHMVDNSLFLQGRKWLEIVPAFDITQVLA